MLWDLLKTKQQVQNGGAYAKPWVTKLRLNLQFWCSQKWNLKSVNQESPTSTCQVTCLLDPCYPLKESDLAIYNLYFTLVPLPGPCSFCLYKSFILYSCLELLSICYIGCCLIQINFFAQTHKIFNIFIFEHY